MFANRSDKIKYSQLCVLLKYFGIQYFPAGICAYATLRVHAVG